LMHTRRPRRCRHHLMPSGNNTTYAKRVADVPLP
jgi:hypothetical protein